jgi:hypothetical protein
MAIKDNWNWSRSSPFYALPFYHTGAKVTYPFTPRLAVTAAVYNGWNSVTDNNAEKSLSLQLTYVVPDVLALSVLYFSGVERASGAAEGRAWRHLLDAHLTLRLTKWLEALVHANGGIEPNAFGVSAWLCGAAYLRFQLVAPLFIVVRGDFFWERTAAGASAIFWPAPAVGSATLTLEYRPVDRISIRLELRHDHASSPIYFAGATPGDVPNRPFQDTLTLGIIGWF